MAKTPTPDTTELEQRFITLLIAGDLQRAFENLKAFWDLLRQILELIEELEERAYKLEEQSSVKRKGQ